MQTRRSAMVVLLACALLAAAGCDEEVAAEFTALSGGCVADLVNVLVTRYWEIKLGVEAGELAHEEEPAEDHGHAAGPLHDFEH